MIMKASKKKIKIIVEMTDTGFSAFAEDYPVFTTGRTVSELTDNALEAANLYFEEEGIALNHDNLKFEIDFKQFFQHYKVINAKFLAEKIGMNPTLLSQYVQGLPCFVVFRGRALCVCLPTEDCVRKIDKQSVTAGDTQVYAKGMVFSALPSLTLICNQESIHLTFATPSGNCANTRKSKEKEFE